MMKATLAAVGPSDPVALELYFSFDDSLTGV